MILCSCVVSFFFFFFFKQKTAYEMRISDWSSDVCSSDLVWDLRLTRDADLTLSLPEGHTAMLVVLGGHLTVEGKQEAGEAEMLMLSREGSDVNLHANGDTTVLVLTGAPIDEPIVGYGPFVMNPEAEIRPAHDGRHHGRFAQAARTKHRPPSQ